MQGWPEPYMYIVHGRIFGEFPAKNAVCTANMTLYMVVSLPKYRIHAPYIGEFLGVQRISMVLANPAFMLSQATCAIATASA